MTNEDCDPRENFTTRWLRACATGWVGGLALVLLLTVLWDVVGGVAQFMVGVGMGAGVGWMQSRVLSPWLPQPKRWVLASLVGMSAPFVVTDIVSLLGGSIYSLQWTVLAGSVVTGLWQTRLLQAVLPDTRRWWLWSVIGWMVPVTVMAIGDRSNSPVVGALSILCIFLGGIILGAITGPPLARMLTDARGADAPAASDTAP